MSGAGGPAAGPAAAAVLHTTYADSMRDVIRFLTAIMMTPSTPPPAGVDANAAFHERWKAIGSPETSLEMNTVLQQLFDMPVSHFQTVMAGLHSDTRQCFHAYAMALAQGLYTDMPEMSQAVSMLQWVMRALSSVASHLPEDSQLGTSADLQQKYAAVDATARIARPDDANPLVAESARRLRAATDAVSSHQAAAAAAVQRTHALQARLAGAGLPAEGDPASDAATLQAQVKAKTASSRSTIIALSVVLAIVAVVAIVLGVLYATKAAKGTVGGTPSSFGGRHARTAILGGGGGGTPRTPAPMSVAGPAVGTCPPIFDMSEFDGGVDGWGFPPLPPSS